MKKYVIDHGCKKCCSCLWACPVQAIHLTRDSAEIDQSTCRHCGACYESCPTEAISVTEMSAPPPPVSDRGHDSAAV